jgi:hypothetical protein
VHDSKTTPAEALYWLSSQVISDPVVEVKTLPQYVPHGEAGATSRAVAEDAASAVLTKRRLAALAIVRGRGYTIFRNFSFGIFGERVTAKGRRSWVLIAT